MLVKRSSTWKLELGSLNDEDGELKGARAELERLRHDVGAKHKPVDRLREEYSAAVATAVGQARRALKTALVRAGLAKADERQLADALAKAIVDYRAVRAGKAQWPSLPVWEEAQVRDLALLDDEIKRQADPRYPEAAAAARESKLRRITVVADAIASRRCFELKERAGGLKHATWRSRAKFSTGDPRILAMDTAPFQARPLVWIYRGICYETDPDYPLSEREVLALLTEKDNNARLQVQKAMALLTMRQHLDTRGARQKIPQEVKIVVWQRDGGRCVECSSQRELEFDHIIPLALGGSNTDRNLQLLCGGCNRRKGATLG